MLSERSGDICSRVFLTISKIVAFVRQHVAPDMTNGHVAATVRCENTTFTVIDGYIPLLVEFDCHRLDAILQQTLPPYVIRGDFNAYNLSWGSTKNTTHGRTLLDLVLRHRLIVMNGGRSTFLVVPISTVLRALPSYRLAYPTLLHGLPTSKRMIVVIYPPTCPSVVFLAANHQMVCIG